MSPLDAILSVTAFAAMVVAVHLVLRRRQAESRVNEMVRLSRAIEYAQADAQAAAARYQQIFEACPQPMWLYDADTLAFIAVNDAAIRHYGWSQDEFRAMTIMDIRPESERDALRAVLDSYRVLNQWPARREWTHLTKDGRSILVEISAGDIRIDGREARLIVANDITERRRAEEALRRSEQDYHSLVDGAPYGIYRSTREGRFTMVNAALVAMLGYDSADELLELESTSLLYADPARRERLAAEASTGGGTRFSVEVEWRRKDGSPIYVLLTGRPVRSDGGAVAWFEVIVQDLSERRTLEQQLRQAQKMEAVGQLAGGIAHDFNNLLTTIIGTLDLLEESDPGPEARRADLRDIRRAAQRGAELTRKLLAFGRRQRLDTRTFDLGSLAAEFMVMARRVVPENIEVEFAIEHDCTVIADAGAIEQILLNLLTNARDATLHGGAIRVTITRAMLGDDQSAALGCRAGEYAEIRVLDTGQGMDTETQRRIFEPFFTTKPVEKGSGLGMAMVYGLVKQHKGGIRVESEIGLGSIVRVFLPLVAGRAAAEPWARAAAKPVSREPRAPATILLVEDEEPLRRVARRVLERFGFTVTTAGDGQAALDLFRERPERFDLVITDIVMPRLGGVALLEALRGIRPDIRILCTSGYPARDTALHGGGWENVPFLPKPWTMDGLIAKVDETLAAPVVR